MDSLEKDGFFNQLPPISEDPFSALDTSLPRQSQNLSLE